MVRGGKAEYVGAGAGEKVVVTDVEVLTSLVSTVSRGILVTGASLESCFRSRLAFFVNLIST